MIEIIPALMPQSFEDLKQKLTSIGGQASIIQIDVMDGNFVGSTDWPYEGDVKTFADMVTNGVHLPDVPKIKYEIDLMVSEPEKVLNDWVAVGASKVIVHVESTKNLEDIVKKMQQVKAFVAASRNIELALALNIDTPIDTIIPYLEEVSGIQFMGIADIGYQGQFFDERVIAKIREFHDAHSHIVITVDGGVSLENAKALVEVGVSRLVVGSAILKSGNIPEAFEKFRKVV